MSHAIASRFWLTTAMTAGVGGALVSAALLSEHLGGWQPGPSRLVSLGLCGAESSPTMSCAEALASRWGSVDLVVGTRRVVIPTAYFGLVYFAAALIWLVSLRGSAVTSTPVSGLTALGAGVGLIGSVALTAVMAFDLSQWCVLCLAAHGFNVVLVGSLVAMRRVRFPVERLAPGRAFAGVAIVVAFSVGLWMYFDEAREARRQWRKVEALRGTLREMATDPDFVRREFLAQPVRTSLAASDESPTIVLFTDFQCSACKCFEGQWQRTFRNELPANARIEYRHLPDGFSGVSPDGAFERACAGEAALRQDNPEGYAAMRQLLFRAKSGSERTDYAGLAGKAGLDPARLEADRESGEVRGRVEANLALARSLGVGMVPAAFIDGRLVPPLCLESRVFWANLGAWTRPEPGPASVEATRN